MGRQNFNTTEEQKQVMIYALEANYGNVKKAAKAAKIVPSTHYRWRKEDEAYEERTDNLRDICFRELKENLINLAFQKAQKDSAVLNQLLRIFLKDLPEEMRILNRCNNIPMRAKIKYVFKPPATNEHASSGQVD